MCTSGMIKDLGRLDGLRPHPGSTSRSVQMDWVLFRLILHNQNKIYNYMHNHRTSTVFISCGSNIATITAT